MSRLCLLLAAAALGCAGAGGDRGASRATAPQAASGPAREIAALVAAYHDVDQFDGVVAVVDHGRVIYRGAAGLANREWRVPHTLESRFDIASMTKPMTAIVVLQLVDEGKLRLDAPVAEYVPAFRTAALRAITIEQLLRHRSGLQQDIAFADDPADVSPTAAMVNADLLSLEEIVRLIAERPLRFAPGSDYGYSSDGYAVLGAAIEHVTGHSYWDELAARVLRPAGMTSTVPAFLTPIIPHRVDGYRVTFDRIENGEHIGPTPAGGLYAPVDDLIAWERALAGDTLMSARSKQLVFAVRTEITAYGWKTSEVERGGKPVLVARTTGGLPGFVHVLERIPSEGRAVMALCNVRGPASHLDQLVAGVHAILDGGIAEPPRRSVATEAAAVTGGAAAITRELERMADAPDRYYVDEGELNRLGYHLLLVRRDPQAAIAVLGFNAVRFPSSPNVHDSLGEAYMAAGDKAAAIRSYEKVLELDPGNANATNMLERLRGN
jgi:CubicO group peptidase (beta-lactamase class C family)